MRPSLRIILKIIFLKEFLSANTNTFGLEMVLQKFFFNFSHFARILETQGKIFLSIWEPIFCQQAPST